MGFKEAVRACLGRYVQFSGRAIRAEFWWFLLFAVGVFLITDGIDQAVFGPYGDGFLLPLAQLALFLPLMAVTWRRLHDMGKPGWVALFPLAFTTVFFSVLFGGIFAVVALEKAGVGEDNIRIIAGVLTYAGIAVASLVQAGFGILLLWWLSRPSEPGANAYGPAAG